MTRTEKVSIGGYAFSLDAEAYSEIKAYLEELSAYYENKSGGKDILEEIEDRLAEILLEKSGAGVVTKDSVRSAIDVLGRPSSIEQGVPEEDEEKVAPKRRLFRDTDNRVISGTLAGISAYFKLDVTIVRVAFVLLAILASYFGNRWNSDFLPIALPVLYFICWFCMPPAKTVRQKLMMKGEKGDVSEIERRVDNSEVKVKNDIRQSYAEARYSFLNVCRGILRVIVGVLLVMVGLSGLSAGVFFSIGTFIWTNELFDAIRNWMTEYPNIAPFIAPFLVKCGIVLVCLLPFLGMIYEGLKLLFCFKAPSWHPGLVIFLVWIVCLLALLVWGLVKATNLMEGLII